MHDLGTINVSLFCYFACFNRRYEYIKGDTWLPNIFSHYREAGRKAALYK